MFDFCVIEHSACQFAQDMWDFSSILCALTLAQFSLFSFSYGGMKVLSMSMSTIFDWKKRIHGKEWDEIPMLMQL
jgi:hypothetical protein